MNNLNQESKEKIIHHLSHNGKFVVRFVDFPEYPEIFEFIKRPADSIPTRYINTAAREGANVSKLI